MQLSLNRQKVMTYDVMNNEHVTLYKEYKYEIYHVPI